jgi:UDP-N-acetylglucosamine 2-epimerase (non-hydrolysing)
MIIDLVVGCRPNFVKAAAIIDAAKSYPNIKVRLIHTGQHHDAMSDPFFKEFNLPNPDWQMLTGYRQSAAVRTGDLVSGISSYWSGNPKPDYAMVVGDTDSSLAGAIAAKKSGLKLVHVEAGLRSGVDTMQEEINRKAIDSIADIFYATTDGARENLLREGHERWKIAVVGNVMVDTLMRHLHKARHEFGRPMNCDYAMLTLHRAENVDSEKMDEIIDAVGEVAKNIPVIFPKHPRGHVRLYANGLMMVPPMSYHQFISTLSRAQFIMTDSGGVQEESTALGIPCVTIRPNTERPETVFQGTNMIAGTKSADIISTARQANYARFDTTRIDIWISTGTRKPPLWDGKAAYRLFDDLEARCKTL